MKTSTIVIATALLLAGPALAKQEKSLVCHVGNQLGSQGETWMENRNCEVPEGWEGDYTCPDAGKVDLIVVANAHKHLNNKSHSWDGLSDYDPIAEGASADSTEDLNGDGIDDGCEIPSAEACPCWDEQDLLAVTAENQNSWRSCMIVDVGDFIFPNYAEIANDPMHPDTNPESASRFYAYSNLPGWPNDVNACGTVDVVNDNYFYEDDITPAEAAACVEQIAARCAAIGDSIYPVEG